jgi:glycosyltransferase involved in cell wall biosynthesis
MTLAAMNNTDDDLGTGDLSDRQLTIAIPNLSGYTSKSGIGRVIKSLCDCWGERVRVVPAQFHAPNLPILRNNPHAVSAPQNSDLILLPQLTGAQALRDSAGIPSLVIVHDVGIVDFRGDSDDLDWITSWTIRRSLNGLRFADQIIAVSEFTKQRLSSHLPDLGDRVRTIHNGVSDVFRGFESPRARSREFIESQVGSSLGGPILIYVGTEQPRKNMKTLLEAFKRVQAVLPNSQLLKVGAAGKAAWRENTLRSAHDLGIRPGEDLVMLEGIDDQLLAHAYRAANVFISASLYEGFGLPALEALAVGTPVVVTNQGSFPELVNGLGWVVDANPSNLANAVLSELQHPTPIDNLHEREQLAQIPSWLGASRKYLEVFNSLANGVPFSMERPGNRTAKRVILRE